MNIVIKVGEEEIETIQHLANQTWKTVYAQLISNEQLDYMLNLFYSTTSLQNQITKLGHQFVLIKENNCAIGFASYGTIYLEESSNIFKLHKIYILPTQHKKGLGKILLDYIINDIKKKGATSLQLNVNRKNIAVHFYQKNGFKIIKEEDIDIGNNYFMNDFVMEKNI